jgi:hypothetical protein
VVCAKLSVEEAILIFSLEANFQSLNFQVLTMIIQREYLEKAKLSAPATFDYVSLAQHTEGYTPADLKDLVGIAIQQSLIRQSHSTDVVSSSGWHTQPSLCDC